MVAPGTVTMPLGSFLISRRGARASPAPNAPADPPPLLARPACARQGHSDAQVKKEEKSIACQRLCSLFQGHLPSLRPAGAAASDPQVTKKEKSIAG